jgi:hypothetical protein
MAHVPIPYVTVMQWHSGVSVTSGERVSAHITGVVS